MAGGLIFISSDAVAAMPIAAHAASQPAGSVKYYIVRDSFGGQQEFLFEIAQRFLGDGNRFNEIFDLNKGRPQPTGGALEDPTSVLPGWILVLPSDAKGDGVQFGPIPGATAAASRPTAPASPTPRVSASASPPIAAVAPSDSDPSTSGPAARTSSAQQETTAVARPNAGLIAWLIGATVLLVAAVLVLLMLARRRRHANAIQRGVITSDRSAAWTIDRALKLLLAAADAEGLPFPGVYLVTADADSIAVTLANPSTVAPTGWTASADGRTWSAPLAQLQAASTPAGDLSVLAALATLGTTSDGRLLLDFAQAGGAVAVDGAGSAVSEVVEGWVAELTGNPWSGPTRVVRVVAGDERFDPSDGVLAALGAGERGVAVFDEVPSRAQADQIRRLVGADSDAKWVVLIKAPWGGATWRFTARDGVLTSAFLPDIRYAVPTAEPSVRVPTPAA